MTPLAGDPVALAAIAAAALVVVAASSVLHINRRRQAARICRRWGLDPGRVRVVASDLGRHRASWSLRADGLAGNPDVIFRERATRHIIIGEAKSRHYRGSITPYELYQVTLYLGMASRIYRQPAKAILLFGNGRRVPVEFDPAAYRHLLALLPHCRRDTGRR